MLREQAPSCVPALLNWFDMREQAPGANLLHDSVSGASSLVCTEICFAGACFRSKFPRVYWLGYLPGSVFRERVSGASSFVCTGCSTYPGACFGSVFQEQVPSCVPALNLLSLFRPKRCYIQPYPTSFFLCCGKAVQYNLLRM